MTQEEAQTELHRLRFATDVFARYHQRRRGFYMFLDRLVKGVSVLAGSAAAVALGQTITGADVGAQIILAATFIIAVLNAWDLVVGFPDRAREHEDLRRRYVQLLIQIEKDAKTGVDQAKVTEWTTEYMSVTADETPTFWAIYAQCWNQVGIATRAPKELLRHLPWWKLYPGYILRMHERSFPTISGQEG